MTPENRPTTAAQATPAPMAPVRLWAMVVIAGLAAGFAAWYAGEAFHGYYTPALASVSMMQTVSQRSTEETEAFAVVQNAALVSAILGASLGIALGLAGGLARGNVKAALGAAVVGALAGTAAGFLAARAVVPIYQRTYQPLSESLLQPFLCHGAIWSAIGAAGGLAFGVGYQKSRIGRAILGGIVGGLIGTAVYELIGAVAFPLDRTFQPISNTSLSRLVARLSVTLAATLGVVIATQSAERTRPPQGAATS